MTFIIPKNPLSGYVCYSDVLKCDHARYLTSLVLGHFIFDIASFLSSWGIVNTAVSNYVAFFEKWKSIMSHYVFTLIRNCCWGRNWEKQARFCLTQEAKRLKLSNTRGHIDRVWFVVSIVFSPICTVELTTKSSPQQSG